MKKTKIVGLLLLAGSLCGCSSGSSASGTSNWIDCYSITVKDGTSTVFTGTYSSYYSQVFEYKNANGGSLYTSQRIVWNDYQNQQYGDATIRTYSNRYTSNYTEYTYNGFVGWLTQESNYYFDVNTRIIDSSTKWSQYLYDYAPTSSSAENQRAYEAAKTGYYQVPSSLGGWTSEDKFYKLVLDTTEKSLERHSYTQYGAELAITYQEKWF